MTGEPLRWLTPALADQPGRLLGLLAELPVPVVGLDPSSRVILWNLAAERLFGWSAEEVIGQPLPNVPHDLAQELTGIQERSSREGYAEATVERVAKDGTRFRVVVRKVPLRDEDGRVIAWVAVLEDVTALHRAETVEETLFEWAPVAIWELELRDAWPLLEGLAATHGDRLGEVLESRPELLREVLGTLRLTRANRAALELFSVRSAEELYDLRERFYTPDTRRHFGRIALALLRGELPISADVVPFRAAGSDRWGRVQITPPPGAGAPPSRVLVAMTDLTGVIRAERRSSARDRILHSLAESTGRLAGWDYLDALPTVLGELLGLDMVTVGLLRKDRIRLVAGYHAEGDPIPPTCPVEGTACGEVLRKGSLVVKDLAGRFPECQSGPGDGFASCVGTRLTDENGGPMGVLCGLSRRPLEDTDLVLGILTVAADRMEAELARVQAEEKLRRREELYQDLVEQSGLAIFVDDPAGRLVYVNRRFCELFGYRPEEALGRPAATIIHSEDRERLERRHRERMAGQAEPLSYTARGVTRDGRELALEIDVTPIVSDGMMAGTRCYVRDVTARVSLERQLRQAQKMESLGQLSAGIAHDFNNMLQAILVRAEAASMTRDLPERARKHLNGILSATNKAINLARGLLAIGRKTDRPDQRLDLGKVAAETLKVLDRLLGERVKLEFSPPEEPLTVLGDGGELGQVVMNLAINARDAMPDGGTLAISLRRVELDAAFCERRPWASPGPWALLTVRDTGTGMDKETAERIFEPFFTTKGKDRGTGLGLATVYGIVSGHGGAIEVATEKGRGTVFSVYLPCAQEGAEPQKQEEPAEAQPPPVVAGTTILLAEDEPEVASTLSEVLRSAGYVVLEAADGPRAVTLFREHRDEIAAAVLDVRLPGLRGTQVAEELRKLYPGLPVLFMSGHTTPPQHGEAPEPIPLEPGQAFLKKPFTGAALLKKLTDLLGR